MKTLTTSAVYRRVAAILFQKIDVWRTGNTRKYRQSDVYIDQCGTDLDENEIFILQWQICHLWKWRLV